MNSAAIAEERASMVTSGEEPGNGDSIPVGGMRERQASFGSCVYKLSERHTALHSYGHGLGVDSDNTIEI